MDVLHYVCVDGFSGHSSDGMIYYTHHRNMDVLHYVCVDVSSGHCCE
jgi:hypothetical protein